MGILGRRGRSRMAPSSPVGNVDATSLSNNGYVSTTDTETTTQASGKTITLTPTQRPEWIEAFATGTTGRYTLQAPDGTTMDFNCVPNAPSKFNRIPPNLFTRGALKVVFSVITVDGTGTIGITIWGKALQA